MRKAARLIPAAALLSFALPADAHLVTTGLGPIYDGIAHLVMSPADVALVVALTLLAGMRGARVGRTILAVLPISWLAGGLTGLGLPAASRLEWTTGACFLFVGALVAADRNLSTGVVAAVAATVGSVHGFLAGSALSTTPSGGLELLGGLVAMLVVVTPRRGRRGLTEGLLGAHRRARSRKLDRRHGPADAGLDAAKRALRIVRSCQRERTRPNSTGSSVVTG